MPYRPLTCQHKRNITCAWPGITHINTENTHKPHTHTHTHTTNINDVYGLHVLLRLFSTAMHCMLRKDQWNTRIA